MTNTLNEVLIRLAAQVKADGGELIRYAQEDTIGGYHNNPALAKFPGGSIWGSEGQILYALVRHLKPKKVVEIGGWRGCSATHIAKALMANGQGELWSFDNGVQGGNHGELIPAELREYVHLVGEDGVKHLQAMEIGSVDMLFEDAMHDTPSVRAIAQLAKTALRNGGLLINHDGAKDFAWGGKGEKFGSPVGVEVREGLRQAGMKFYPYITDESDCGLAVSVIEKPKMLEHTIVQEITFTDKHSTPADPDAPDALLVEAGLKGGFQFDAELPEQQPPQISRNLLGELPSGLPIIDGYTDLIEHNEQHNGEPEAPKPEKKTRKPRPKKGDK